MKNKLNGVLIFSFIWVLLMVAIMLCLHVPSAILIVGLGVLLLSSGFGLFATSLFSKDKVGIIYGLIICGSGAFLPLEHFVLSHNLPFWIMQLLWNASTIVLLFSVVIGSILLLEDM